MTRKVTAVVFVLVASVIFSIFATGTQRVSAQVSSECDGSSFLLGLPTWYKYLQVDYIDGSCTVTGPGMTSTGAVCNLTQDGCSFDWRTGAARVALAIVEVLLRISGLVAVGYVIYGGIKYILSQGEPDKTRTAKNTVVNALIGAALAVAATAIVNLIGGALMT